MKSGLLLSVVLVALVAPLITARDPNPLRGIRRLIAVICVYNAIYIYYLTSWHPVLFVPHWP